MMAKKCLLFYFLKFHSSSLSKLFLFQKKKKWMNFRAKDIYLIIFHFTLSIDAKDNAMEEGRISNKNFWTWITFFFLFFLFTTEIQWMYYLSQTREWRNAAQWNLLFFSPSTFAFFSLSSSSSSFLMCIVSATNI